MNRCFQTRHTSPTILNSYQVLRMFRHYFIPVWKAFDNGAEKFPKWTPNLFLHPCENGPEKCPKWTPCLVTLIHEYVAYHPNHSITSKIQPTIREIFRPSSHHQKASIHHPKPSTHHHRPPLQQFFTKLLTRSLEPMGSPEQIPKHRYGSTFTIFYQSIKKHVRYRTDFYRLIKKDVCFKLSWLIFVNL